MQIDRIEVFLLELPLKEPANIDRERFQTLKSVVLKMESDGISGWSEVAPGNLPLRTPDWAGGCFSGLIQVLLPRLAESRSIESTTSLAETLAPVRGNRAAKAALDMAFWDLKARKEEKPLPEAIGAERESAKIGINLDRYEEEERGRFIDDIGAYFERGFSRVGVKLRPGWDLPMLMAVRDRYPLQTIHADVEGGLSLDHSDLLYRLDDFMLAFVEQPLPAEEMVGHAMLQEAIHTPLGLDESITSLSQAEIALDLKAARYYNLKCDRLGGLTPVLEVHRLCKASDVLCLAGAELSTSIGLRFTAAVALLENCDYPADWILTEEKLAEDPGIPLKTDIVREKNDEGETIESRRIQPWKEPGIGFVPDESLLDSVAIDRFTLEFKK